jgi:acyl-CoA synthetase (AMP-forming)/AMP-acid ligase II
MGHVMPEGKSPSTESAPLLRTPLLDQPGLLFHEVMAANARILTSKVAVVCGNERLSWKALDEHSNMAANTLVGLGVQRGDKVCVLMHSSVRTIELMWGIVKSGAVVVPLNLMMAADSLALMINNSDARLLFADSATVSQVEEIRDQLDNLSDAGLFIAGGTAEGWRAADPLMETASRDEPGVPIRMSDTMILIYSSGTTGTPKGIELSHFARHNYSLGVGPALGMDRSTISICTTPLYTNGTWMMMLPTLYWGGTLVLLPKFNTKAFAQAVERERCTHTFMVPTQAVLILGDTSLSKYDFRSLRVFLSAGAPLLASTYEALCAALPEAGIYELYGQTEGFLTLAGPADFARGKRGSVGLPLFGAVVRIVGKEGSEVTRGELGEIVGYGPGLMKGYYKDAQRTEEAIWRDAAGRTYIRSGDIGRLDEDGYLYIAGRVKDMIISGGINIFASDIEAVFIKHPDVQEVAAIGVPHEKWGETPLLFAILRNGSVLSEVELMAWGNARLGKYQRVSRVEFLSEFPRAAHDKIRKGALRAPYWESQAWDV